MIVARTLCCFLLLLLAGCATKLVPDDFQGETAILRDSYSNYRDGGMLGPDSAEFFVAMEVDGKPIENALARTTSANYGRGFSMTPVPFERRVPIRTMKIKLFGGIHYAADIAAILNKTYETRREVTFTPKPGGRYVVRGRLGEAGSRLWIEAEGGAVVTQ